jgi:hypothetical protein
MTQERRQTAYVRTSSSVAGRRDHRRDRIYRMDPTLAGSRMPLQDKWYSLIGKKLRDEGKGVTKEPLPRRWLELIQNLDEAGTPARVGERACSAAGAQTLIVR